MLVHKPQSLFCENNDKQFANSIMAKKYFLTDIDIRFMIQKLQFIRQYSVVVDAIGGVRVYIGREVMNFQYCRVPDKIN